jgi:hypothetical protein
LKSITVSDGGHRFSVQVREDVELPALPKVEKPPHARFLDWWRSECSKMNIPYTWRIAEPQGIRIIQSLLKKHSLDELQELGTHFLLDHGDRLREDPRHFSIFASLVPTMQKELKRDG